MRTYSDLDHYEKEVKRRNFVTLFLDNYNADKYIVTHLYGTLNYLDANVSFEELENIFDTSAQNLSQTFDKRAHKVEKAVRNIRKLSPRETYIALLKGFCATAVLMLPITFQNGGIVATPIFIAGSAIVSTICIGKLIDAGLATRLFSYSLIVEKALGKKGRFVLDLMVCLS